MRRARRRRECAFPVTRQVSIGEAVPSAIDFTPGGQFSIRTSQSSPSAGPSGVNPSNCLAAALLRRSPLPVGSISASSRAALSHQTARRSPTKRALRAPDPSMLRAWSVPLIGTSTRRPSTVCRASRLASGTHSRPRDMHVSANSFHTSSVCSVSCPPMPRPGTGVPPAVTGSDLGLGQRGGCPRPDRRHR